MKPRCFEWREWVLAFGLSLGTIESCRGEPDLRDFLQPYPRLPHVYELVFSLQGEAEAAPTYYFLRQGGSNFVVRRSVVPRQLHAQASALGDLDHLMGHCNGDYWSLGKTPNWVVHVHGSGGARQDDAAALPVKTLHEFCMTALRLGLPNAEFGSLKWKHDTFEMQDLGGKEMYRGKLVRDANGRLGELFYTLSPDSQQRRWRLVYAYTGTPTVPAWFPTQMRMFFGEPGLEDRPLYSLSVRSLVLATNSLPAELFQAQQFLDVAVYGEFLVSNNVRYAKAETGAWVKQQVPSSVVEGTKPYRLFFGISAAFVLLAAGGVALRLAFLTRRRHQQPSQQAR